MCIRDSPIGNGRIGAMVYGNPLQEVYQLNEESIWSGYPQDWNNPKAANALPQVREAVDRGDYAKASELWKANAQGPYTARYLPMANLMLDQLKMCIRDRDICGSAPATD